MQNYSSFLSFEGKKTQTFSDATKIAVDNISSQLLQYLLTSALLKRRNNEYCKATESSSICCISKLDVTRKDRIVNTKITGKTLKLEKGTNTGCFQV